MPRKRAESSLPYRDTFSRFDGLKQGQKLHFRHKDGLLPIPSYPIRDKAHNSCRDVDI